MATSDVVNPGWQWRERYTFSPAVRKGNLRFISGMTGTDEDGNVVGLDIVSQTRQILREMEQILAAAGGSCADVVKTADYIATTDNYRGTADVRR